MLKKARISAGIRMLQSMSEIRVSSNSKNAIADFSLTVTDPELVFFPGLKV